MTDFSSELHEFLHAATERVTLAEPIEHCGHLTRVSGLVLEVSGLKLPLGSACLIYPNEGKAIEAEVVGFSEDKLFVMPSDATFNLAPGAKVVAFQNPSPPLILGKNNSIHEPSTTKQLPVGEQLLGRVIDGMGRPLDHLGALLTEETRPLSSKPFNPMARAPINLPLDVGVRAINALLTVGRGQRMGLFAGSGVGKSVLLGMMARYTSAEIIIVGLIGERGREVKEFIEDILGLEGRKRAIVVAAPADNGPLMRLAGAAYATTLAEYFRDQGKHVLLIMDSLTRYAMAQREIALAIGEPPATRGYPPSVFAKLPALVERAGNGVEGGGSITAFYTVLAEGDDQQDPIADSARAILDGHIVLNRMLADSGHYPAIDIEQSISRAMVNLITPEHLDLIRKFKVLFSRYQRSRDLLAVGAYTPGSDPVLDQAVNLYPKMENFLQQKMAEKSSFEESQTALEKIFSASSENQPTA